MQCDKRKHTWMQQARAADDRVINMLPPTIYGDETQNTCWLSLLIDELQMIEYYINSMNIYV